MIRLVTMAKPIVVKSEFHIPLTKSFRERLKNNFRG